MFQNTKKIKWTLFCLLFLFLQTYISAQNQEEIRISGTYRNISLISVLNELEKKHSIIFYYDPLNKFLTVHFQLKYHLLSGYTDYSYNSMKYLCLL